jgi:hypothetical protein
MRIGISPRSFVDGDACGACPSLGDDIGAQTESVLTGTTVVAVAT